MERSKRVAAWRKCDQRWVDASIPFRGSSVARSIVTSSPTFPSCPTATPHLDGSQMTYSVEPTCLVASVMRGSMDFSWGYSERQKSRVHVNPRDHKPGHRSGRSGPTPRPLRSRRRAPSRKYPGTYHHRRLVQTLNRSEKGLSLFLFD